MSKPRLPPELLDDIVDILYADRPILKKCCLVSKSWIPRTRKYIFGYASFQSQADVRLWKTMFPNTSTSPAHYVQSLFVKIPLAAPTDMINGSWIASFSRVVQLELDIERADIRAEKMETHLAPFHGFAPAITVLRVTFYTPQLPAVFNLVFSFPLLERLTLVAYDRSGTIIPYNSAAQRSAAEQPSPPFTGSLKIHAATGMHQVVPRLSAVPGGLHFRRLDLSWTHERDAVATAVLLEKCCSTLESLEIMCKGDGTLDMSRQVDLSRVTKLKEVVLTCTIDPRWILSMLQTVTSDHKDLKRITINPLSILDHPSINCADPPYIRDAIKEIPYSAEWEKLDALLAQLWNSHGVSLLVMYCIPWFSGMTGALARGYMERVFPTVAEKGILAP